MIHYLSVQTLPMSRHSCSLHLRVSIEGPLSQVLLLVLLPPSQLTEQEDQLDQQLLLPSAWSRFSITICARCTNTSNINRYKEAMKMVFYLAEWSALMMTTVFQLLKWTKLVEKLRIIALNNYNNITRYYTYTDYWLPGLEILPKLPLAFAVSATFITPSHSLLIICDFFCFIVRVLLIVPF